jgi:hypothetical protein
VRDAALRTAIKETHCITMTVAGHDTRSRSGCHCLFFPLPTQTTLVAQVGFLMQVQTWLYALRLQFLGL